MSALNALAQTQRLVRRLKAIPDADSPPLDVATLREVLDALSELARAMHAAEATPAPANVLLFADLFQAESDLQAVLCEVLFPDLPPLGVS